MLWLIPFVYFSFVSPRVCSEEDGKLLLVQALFRHGDRAPRHLYPNDPNSGDSWPEGLGKLTLLGKKQQYALGQLLRSMYQDFITTNPNEVLVNSSASDRCLTGAAATVASFYAPEGLWRVDDGLDWQPIPIHYLPLHQDRYLSFRGTCPRATAEMERQLISEDIQAFFQKHRVKFEAVSTYAGLNVSKGINALHLYDTLRVEKLHRLIIPEWAHAHWEELRETTAALFRSFIRSPLVLRLRAGPLLQYINQNIKKKINGELPHLKVQMYSAHDVNVAAVLLALNFTHMPRPPYCATLLFELHRLPDASLAVRLLYLNSTDPLAGSGGLHVLQLAGCSDFCPAERFSQVLRRLVPEDWEEECRLNAEDTCENDSCEMFRVVHNN